MAARDDSKNSIEWSKNLPKERKMWQAFESRERERERANSIKEILKKKGK